jgi:hypothetical protein
MSTRERYEVIKIEGLRYTGRQRGVAFLIDKDDKTVDAEAVYDKLGEKKRGDMLGRFDHWMDGNTYDHYYHGWPNDPSDKHCYSFRWREGKVRHRFYGFLQKTNNFLACVLVSHGSKTEEHTNPTQLNRAEELRATMDVMRALRRTFPELKEKRP